MLLWYDVGAGGAGWLGLLAPPPLPPLFLIPVCVCVVLPVCVCVWWGFIRAALLAALTALAALYADVRALVCVLVEAVALIVALLLAPCLNRFLEGRALGACVCVCGIVEINIW